jgi:hypothetical protein
VERSVLCCSKDTTTESTTTLNRDSGHNYGFLMDFVEDNRSEDENMVETFLHDNISCSLIIIVLAIFRVAQPNARPTAVSISL